MAKPKHKPAEQQRHKLIAMAADFASFLLSDSELGPKIDSIILFGSVARGDYTAESDIDLFVEANPQLEKTVQGRLEVWYVSKRYEAWRLLDLENPISLKTGHLAQWKLLHRAIIADGIQLYGKYIETPKGLRPYVLVGIAPLTMPKAKQVVLSRQLFGYRQRVGKKLYTSPGVVEQLEGERLGRAILLPARSAPKFFEFLRKRRVAYTERDVWSD